MTRVVLREITKENFHECIRLQVAEDQVNNVASNVYSLAQAKVNPRLVPLAIYDGSILGREPRPGEKVLRMESSPTALCGRLLAGSRPEVPTIASAS